MLHLLLSISLPNKLRKTIDPLSLETFNHAHDHHFESPVLSHISSLSPFTIPFLDRLDDLLSGALPLSTFVTPAFWYNWLVYTWEQDPGHLLLEILCLGIILYLWHRRPYDPRDDERLSPQDEEELIRSWKPEPLAAPPPPNLSLRLTPVVSSYNHQHVNIAGRQYVNWVSTNWLGVSSLPQVKTACRETIEKYGVGSCGPRGFYGSFDLHLEVERRLAEFFGGEACILYSDAIATMSSVIPAFSKRGDLIVCDEGCHFGIQQGIRLSRSNVLYYKHNDMDDLERILHQVQEKDMRGQSGGKLNRRFIVTEGISQHHGTITPLPQIIRLKQRYKYRLILDDTMAVGVLGATGRGSLEQFAVDTEQCDMYCASMEASFASVGGFCIGSKQVVNHQRLSGAGYCLPEVDSRVLTDTGFRFLSEIESRLDRGETVLYGCYDTATRSLVYGPGVLKYKAPPARWVDFTQAATRPLWDTTSTDYGAAPGKRRQANYLTLRTTPGHKMYVQLGSRLGSPDRLRTAGDVVVPPHTMRADELAPGFACCCVEKGEECPHGYSAYRFFTAPASGVSNSDIMSIHDTASDSPVVRLGLRTIEQLNAFLELYGYWLGAGSMSYDSATTGAVIFKPKKKRDRRYVLGLIARLPLEPTTEWTCSVNASDSLNVRVTAQRWLSFFGAEYGLTKYARSYNWRAGAADSRLRLSTETDSAPAACPAGQARASSEPIAAWQPGMGRGTEGNDDVIKMDDVGAFVPPPSARISSSAIPSDLPRSSSSVSRPTSSAHSIASTEPTSAASTPGSRKRELSNSADSLRSTPVTSFISHGRSYSWSDVATVSGEGTDGDPLYCLSCGTTNLVLLSQDKESDAWYCDVCTGECTQSAGEWEKGEVVIAKEERQKKAELGNWVDLTSDSEEEDVESDDRADSDTESDGESEDAAGTTRVPPNIKSAKWFWYWVFKRLSGEQVRLVIEGLRQADGVSKRSKKQEAAGSALSGFQRICTSSIEFRDQLIQACLHAGYTAHCTLNTRAGTVRGYSAVPSDYRIYSQEEMELLSRAEPGRVFKPVEAHHDNWWVHYSLLTSWLSAEEVRYDGKALHLREKRKMRQSFVAKHSDGRVERATTQEAGVDDQQGGALPGDARPASAPATTDLADAYSPRDGRTWCVTVAHGDHLIFAQRAHRNAAGVVTKAGLPIIIGNCFSASSPPYTVTAAIQAIEYIDEKPELSAAVREKATTMRKLLSNLPGLQLVGKQTDSVSPLIHLVLKEGSGSRDDDEALLLKMANKVYSDDGMLVHVPEYIAGERQMPPASLQVSVTVEHEEKEMEKLAKAMRKAALDVLGLTTNGKK